MKVSKLESTAAGRLDLMHGVLELLPTIHCYWHYQFGFSTLNETQRGLREMTSTNTILIWIIQRVSVDLAWYS
jgi:hypothetical protein